MPNSIKHNLTHNKILPIEHNRTFDYRTIGDRTQSNVRLPKDDQIFLKSKLPELLEKESRRKKQEEKEKQEKIQQLKAGDPKDMTVILLREVLLELGLRSSRVIPNKSL